VPGTGRLDGAVVRVVRTKVLLTPPLDLIGRDCLADRRRASRRPRPSPTLPRRQDETLVETAVLT
jgi:hypothetical protein